MLDQKWTSFLDSEGKCTSYYEKVIGINLKLTGESPPHREKTRGKTSHFLMNPSGEFEWV